jgi:hypothetical protein
MPQAPNKEAQVREAVNRDLNETPQEPIADGTPQEVDTGVPEVSAAEQQDDDQPRLPSRDNKRAEIVNRFRGRRTSSEAAEDAAEIRAFANNGMPPELLTPEIRDPDDEEDRRREEEERVTHAQQQHEPPKFKVKIRGEERELTQDELITAAQKNLAGDDYLDEHRTKLAEVNDRLRRLDTLEANLRNSGARQPVVEHHDGTQAQPEAQHQSNPFEDLHQTILYKDSEEAAPVIKQTLEAVAEQAATRVNERQRQVDEVRRNQELVGKFRNSHEDIDEIAEAAISTKMFQLQRQDLEKLAPQLGLTPEQLPRDDKTIAAWHLHYRSRGAPVRSMETMVTEAYDGFRQWEEKRGRKPTEQARETEVAERPQVNLDRAGRRLAIPQQPSRAAAPVAKEQVVQPTKRSDVVANMIRQRATPRGKVFA